MTIRIPANKEGMKLIFSDIRFWILLFFIVRLYGITQPPLEVAHNWRQTNVAMVARNFLETDSNIFYPRIDVAGEKSGITGMEFPLLNYLIYLVSLLFGYQHWYGRIINLIVSSFGIYFFHQLLRRYFNDRIALHASLILLCSIWFAYSRKIMPDTFSASLVIIGVYFGNEYLRRTAFTRKIGVGLLAFLFVTMGLLSKLPSASLLVFLLPGWLKGESSRAQKTVFLLMMISGALMVYGWYGYWVPHLQKTYGLGYFFMGSGMGESIHALQLKWPLVLQKFYDDALKFTGFGFFILGIAYAVYRKEKSILWVLLLGSIAFIPVVLKGGDNFARHSYYIIPFVPVMAVLAAYGTCLPKGWKSSVLVIVICLEGILNQQHDFRIKEKDRGILSLEHELDKFSNSGELILINSGEYPTPMYFAHRKGWVLSNEQIQQQTTINELKGKGLKTIVILKRTFGSEISLALPKRMENEDYCVYRIGN